MYGNWFSGLSLEKYKVFFNVFINIWSFDFGMNYNV